mmetsp:Transcript_18280/g.36428  ORF Transcript_18280/g.36428 Transcript_18280/m.36428 type:complete len:977 (-) Transcript_18280:130-3060(-)
MRFSVAFLTASAAVFSIGVHASNSLSRDELDSIIKTVATSDFGLLLANSAIGPTTTDITFSSKINTQWNINVQQPDETAPYLVCETTPGLSGYERAVRIETLCSRNGFGQDIVQNLEERTCFNDQLDPANALACSMNDDHIHVVPYSSWNKISAASFIESLGENFDVVESVRYAGNFCEDPSSNVNRNHNVARWALKQTFGDNGNCVSSLITVGGSRASFTDIFSFNVKESRLLLRQMEGKPALPVGCVLSLVESLASHPFVCSVEYDPPVIIFNHEARWIIQGSVYGDNNSMDLPLHQVGISGENQVVQMSDTGVSVNSCYFFDNDGEVVRDKSANVDSARRKVIQYYAKASSEDESGHGSHCAGTILGKVCPDCSTSSNRDGAAPEAKIAVYDIGGSKYLYPDLSDPMFVRGMTAGATVHSASWGNRINSYQNRDLDYDRFQHQNDSFLVVFAAGNSGTFNTKNTSTGVAKNNLNVCASKNKGQGLGELYTAHFSSMGPSADGRIKPDICAPGHSISSASNGLNRQCNSASMSGTSMACPGVAGAALLVRQYFVDGFSPSGTKVPEDGFEPSGALVKAVILNSGRVMLGRDNGNFKPVFPSTEFDESQGFGLISLVDGLYLQDKSKGKVLVWDREPLTSGQEWNMSFQLGTCMAEHTSVTLSYFDKENNSISCNPCIVNRLDLTVEKDGITYYPNGLTKADVKNNSQRIRIPHIVGDLLTVKVRATNLATDKQKFALVVSGCLDVDIKGTTTSPTISPTDFPTSLPSKSPTKLLTKSPTLFPSISPTSTLTDFPNSEYPTLLPSDSTPTSPTGVPTKSPTVATKSPTLLPSESPTLLPSKSPTLLPTKASSLLPSKPPTTSPTGLPTNSETGMPTPGPQAQDPTLHPTLSPTDSPTFQKTWRGCNTEVRNKLKNRRATIKREHEERKSICSKKPWRAKINCYIDSLTVFSIENRAAANSRRAGFRKCRNLYKKS